MEEKKYTKVMSAKEAVARYLFDGAVVGLGGQNIGRCTMAVVHEIIRQSFKNLTVVGCNLSISMDMLVGCGMVRRTESGTGNLERFGSTFMWRKAVQKGLLEHEDFSHLAMVSRFLAAEMGVPFMPTKSLLGTDILKYQTGTGGKKFEIIKNPWNMEEDVVLLPALSPDVSIVHVSLADELGNLYIDGFTTHEPEMVRASKKVIATCEKVVSSEQFRSDPERTTIPYFFVDAVVEQPGGAHPTSVYRYYDYDKEAIEEYQKLAEDYATGQPDGEKKYREYMEKCILSSKNFDEYLEKMGGSLKLKELHESMKALIQGGARDD